MGIRAGIYATKMTNMDLDQIEANYIRILEAGQHDVLASLETGNPKDFFAALERHKALTESVKNGVEAYTVMTTTLPYDDDRNN